MIAFSAEKVELYLSCRKLKTKDKTHSINPQVKISLHDENKDWIHIGNTETAKNTINPNFHNPLSIDFTFEIEQILLFEVINVSHSSSSEKIGSVEIPLGKIMGAKKQLLISSLKDNEGLDSGKIVIQGEKAMESFSEVIWQWSGIKIKNTSFWFSKGNPFLRFLMIREGGDLLQVYETEPIMNNLNPTWKVFNIMDSKLCRGNHTKPFKIECWDCQKDGENQFIGACELQIDHLKKGKAEFELKHPQKKENTGKLKLASFKLVPQFSFMDYIRGGQQIKIVVGIDFTGSNKIPSDPNSLHAINPQRGLNPYQKAIYAVCNNLINYDYDKMVPVYGFGGVPHYPGFNLASASHCFPCNGNPLQPGVFGVEGIMNVYQYALQNVELSGPTYFSPIISEVMKLCKIQKEASCGFYTVLLILTDGEIHDMEKSVNCLIECVELPLSIIVVGIGSENFYKMERIDGKKEIRNEKGEKAQRNLIQFVPFKKLNEDMQLLAKHVLADVPDQLVKYMEFIGKKPNPPVSVDMNQVGYSQTSFSQSQGLVQSFGPVHNTGQTWINPNYPPQFPFNGDNPPFPQVQQISAIDKMPQNPLNDNNFINRIYVQEESDTSKENK